MTAREGSAANKSVQLSLPFPSWDLEAALAYLESLRGLGSRPGLERIQRLLKLAGQPQEKYRVIHVTGTNGKGSVTSFLSSILMAAGYRVGTFTSPYLESVLDSIRVDGRPISASAFATAASQLAALLDPALSNHLPTPVSPQEPRAEGWSGPGGGTNLVGLASGSLSQNLPLRDHPTEFEFLTALALYSFAQYQVQWTVVEVGLGGARDATNVFTQPAAVVITNVGYDHMNLLGENLAEIAREKAGIIKKGSVAITAATAPEALAVIEEVAAAQGVPLFLVGRDLTWVEKEYSRLGQVVDTHGPWRDYTDLRLGLLGRHQQVNAATALLTAEVLRRRGVDLPEGAVRAGLAEATWPGRFEILNTVPPVVLDGAHNRDGARVLRQALVDTFPGRKIVLVLSILRDKEVERILEALLPLTQLVLATQSTNPRVLPVEELAAAVKRWGSPVEVEPDPIRAVRKALQKATSDQLVVVTGSLYLLSEVYGSLRAKNGL